jgi:hypothetical protein
MSVLLVLFLLLYQNVVPGLNKNHTQNKEIIARDPGEKQLHKDKICKYLTWLLSLV